MLHLMLQDECHLLGKVFAYVPGHSEVFLKPLVIQFLMIHHRHLHAILWKINFLKEYATSSTNRCNIYIVALSALMYSTVQMAGLQCNVQGDCPRWTRTYPAMSSASAGRTGKIQHCCFVHYSFHNVSTCHRHMYRYSCFFHL